MNIENLQAELVKFDEPNHEDNDPVTMKMLERAFPYDEMRPQQRDILQKIADT